MSVDLTFLPDLEIVTRRKFLFSPSLVFSAFSNPDHLKTWWGPNGFTNTFHAFEFREGGRWTFTMHGPEKGNYQNDCVFLTIRERELIIWDRLSMPKFMVIVEFVSLANVHGTELIFRQRFSSEEECNKIKKYVLDKNEENMDRLQAELEKM